LGFSWPGSRYPGSGPIGPAATRGQIPRLRDIEERRLSVRLKLEDSRKGLVATISQRNDAGHITGRPSIFLVSNKEEAKQRAKALARTLGLKSYGIVDKTSTGSLPNS
jgi:hypothetical protein